ncbi:hypothetical protein ER308_03435 [Egibacter rhizosphaerae]|uniref:Cysteinyl-tRNA ligase anticodon binding domain-containing protein n=1 Tax=Egibacter rhizosphaerae TaxID=1670831 RepID=A0A411YBX1_9ACTN|nr:hypothetical protein [Egibacter rhizosphaerae]QBI18699.1 hypothetical protein ER308_03435 [Egibacter rhizosphaerae]
MTLVVLMGSGETAPPLAPVHRTVLTRVGEGPAVLLDTPFGFQENADDLVARARKYFADTVGRPVEPVRWRRADAPTVEREAAIATLRDAVWAFAGPGSPTYALTHWRGTPIPAALVDLVRRGGALVLGSAAAVVAGTHAVPVYEIYKAGFEPHWATGLDLLGTLASLPAAVIPHFDNAEGGTHDTRYCYLGERRLARMEAELPAGTGVLGIDEHTALVLDLAASHARIEGRSAATVRVDGEHRRLPAGTTLPIDRLRAMLRGDESGFEARVATEQATGVDSDAATASLPHATDGEDAGSAPASLMGEAAVQRERFDTAIERRDVSESVGAILDLEAAIVAWSTDTLQSDEADRARAELRRMVVRLGELAEVGARDPRGLLAPLVSRLLQRRERARDTGDYPTADELRDALLAADIEVRDTPEGPEWLLGDDWHR